MSVSLAYLGIILIWATTPLAIQWSTQGSSFAFAVLARMSIGALVAALLIALWRISFPLHARARRAYAVSGVGLFGAMALTYWGAQRVHSGLVSVLFGLSPLVAGLLSPLLAKGAAPTRMRVAGSVLGAVGLAVIFLKGGGDGDQRMLLGLCALLLAVVIYTGSLVLLKHIGDDSPPLATTLASLALSLPCFGLLWLWSDGQVPQDLTPRAGAAIVYLGVFGSVLGFALYYYVIKHLDASRVALITLITPVMALALGHALNGEALDTRLLMGAGLILAGLAVHESETWRPLLARLRR